MASYIENWWKKHDMDKDGKGCALGCLLVFVVVFVGGVSFGCFLFWSIFL